MGQAVQQIELGRANNVGLLRRCFPHAQEQESAKERATEESKLKALALKKQREVSAAAAASDVWTGRPCWHPAAVRTLPCA